jgi:hypothetical protein
MFQPTFDTSTEDQLGWDEFGYGDILVIMDAVPQQAEEVGASQLTQRPPVLTQPSQLTPAGDRATLAGGGATLASGATPAGGATSDAAGSLQAAMATPSPDQLGPRVVRAPDPWTYDRDHT